VITGASTGSMRYYYTLDGSTPSASSAQYLGPVELAGGWPDVNRPPLTLLVEDAAGTVSEVKSFAIPTALPQPHVALNHGVLTVEATVGAALQDSLEYRFTTDGSDPTCDSALYVNPVTFSEPYPVTINVKAFPKLFFPSQSVQLTGTSGSGTAGPAPQPGFAANGSTMSPSPQRPAPRSPSPLPSPQQPSPQQPSPAGQPSPHPTDGSSTARNFPVQWRSRSEREGHSNNLTYMSKCHADGNMVYFTFEREVCLERVTITTPGEGLGPAAYTCMVTQQQRRPNGQVAQHQVNLCDGQLSQDPGEADLEILEYGDVRCIGLQVEFWPLPGESSFQITQFHLFGTVAQE